VAASRATDSTELFVLTEPDETASTGDGDEELGRAWSRSEQQRLALDELETGAEIARLAGTPREVLGEERDTLVSLIGAGPAVDLTTRQVDASRELGISLVQRDEAHEEAGVFATMSATSEGIERRNLQGPYTAARHRLGRAERDVTEAAELSEAADAALSAQQSVRAVLGTDVRSALDRLELVDSALATLRRREIERWSSEPAEYVVALLGPRPSDQGRAQRWRQGTVEIEDWRRSVGVTMAQTRRTPGRVRSARRARVGRAEGADASSRTSWRCDVTSVSRRPVALGPLTPVLCSTRRRLRCSREVEAASHRLFLDRGCCTARAGK